MSEKLEAVATSEPRQHSRLQPGREGQRIRVRLRPAGHRPGHRRTGGESAGEQAAQALKNIKHILDTAGSGIENVVRATIYMKNVEDFHEVDDVYAQTFIGSVKPARVPLAATTFRRARSSRSTPSPRSEHFARS
mgnify:CR=1 FL=1